MGIFKCSMVETIYYTPDISEIRIGLEFEARVDKKKAGAMIAGRKVSKYKWVTYLFDIDMSMDNFMYLWAKVRIRCHYLNRADIIQLRWKPGNVWNKFYKEGINRKYVLTHIPDSRKYVFWMGQYTTEIKCNGKVVMHKRIKNKTELLEAMRELKMRPRLIKKYPNILEKRKVYEL